MTLIMLSFLLLISSLTLGCGPDGAAGNSGETASPVRQPADRSEKPPVLRGRPVFVFAADGNNPLFLEQVKALEQDPAGLRERDISVTRVVGRVVMPMGENPVQQSAGADQWRKLLGVADEDAFEFILVGKDGGVKVRSSQVVSLERLYGTIDSMPMRQREMRQRETRPSQAGE